MTEATTTTTTIKKRSIVNDYILNTSIHGFRFLAETGLHWSERFLWVIICVLCWAATGLLILSSWNDFQNNAISFVIDTNYLEWDTNFPSIAVCESDNEERVAEISDSIFGDPHDYNLDEIVRESVYYEGVSYYTLQICGPNALTYNEECFKRNLSEFPALIRSDCEEIFRTCHWNDEQFDCCEFFQKIGTEIGWCFIINSIQHWEKEKVKKRYPMISNHKTGPGSLKLELNGYSKVHVLGEQEVPSLTTSTLDVLYTSPHVYLHRFIGIKEIDNQLEVKDVSVRQRKCRFEDETDFDVYPQYSYSACCVQCRKNAQFQKCGCIHHLLPKTPTHYECNVTGLYCLNQHYTEFNVLKPSWSVNRPGLFCHCLPSCTEIELSVIKDDRLGIQGDYALVEISLERLPTERFKRNVVRDQLDLVVSIGGSAALFLGASILSVVEILYFFTLRAIHNRKIKRNKQSEI